MSALQTIGLSKIYKGKKGRRIAALTGLDLAVSPGEVFGFLGPNGAGKSTTIKAVMGQIRPTAGVARIFGISAVDPAARMKVGYLPENPAFFDFMTAREYLAFIGKIFSMDKGRVTAESDRVLTLLDIEEAADRPIRGYSKGMVQRLGLAQALLHDPDLYILDEPMSGLDPIGRALVKEIIKDLKNRGKTVFFSTHITADVEVICDRVGVIAKGKLLAVDSVEKILRSGIEGYVIQLNRADGTVQEMFVEKDCLREFMKDAAAADTTIERIEPKRRDMEAFFLDIVQKEYHASKE